MLFVFGLLLVPTASASASPGQVFAFGYNFSGQLGSPTNNGVAPPAPNPTAALVGLPGASGPVVQLAAGEQFSLVVTSTGQLFAFGENKFGQLGNASNNGTANPNPTATLVSLPAASGPVVQVAAGRAFSLAVTSTGQLYAFGENLYGQLGNGSSSLNPNPTPTLVALPGAGGPVSQIAAGAFHSLVVTSTGQLYTFGRNDGGQLGSATNSGTLQPTPTPALVSLPGASGPVSQIAAGAFHSLAVTSTGQLYAFGENLDGQLGNATNNGSEKPNPTPTPVSLPGASGPVVQASGGYSHTLALTATGQLYAFGYNFYGQLGNPTNNGGENNSPNPTPALVGLPGSGGPVVQIAGGEEHSVAVTSTGQLYAFGANFSGQLGTATNSGTGTPTPTPAVVAFPPGTTIDTVAHGPEAGHTLALVAEIGVLNATLPAAQVGAPYRAAAQGAGGLPPYSWSASGLPAGLSIDGSGQITGTPTTAGASNVVLHISDVFGVGATSATIALTVAPAADSAHHLGATRAQIHASLLAQLSVRGKSAKIAALRRRKGYSYSFTALTAGALAINWYYLPPGAHLSKKVKPKPVLFAGGTLSFRAAGTNRITIKLTRKGQKLLRHRKTIKLTAKGSFRPTGQQPITATKGIRLTR